MKRFFLLLALSLTCLSLLAATAEAKRFGGGGSIGKQRSVSPTQAQKAPAATPAAAPAQPAGNRWLGPLAGLAMGVGLGALFASMGLGEGMGMLLLIVLVAVLAMFLVSALRRRSAVATQYAGAGAPYADQYVAQPTLSGGAGGGRIPAGFPVEAFLRGAKTSFIRLQAANDRKDLNDIREYTTPEMFAEISMQIRERDSAPQQTEVLSLNAELLEVLTEGDYAVASVRLYGEIRESQGQNPGTAAGFDEIWNVQKDLRDEKAAWLLCGIQQVA